MTNFKAKQALLFLVGVLLGVLVGIYVSNTSNRDDCITTDYLEGTWYSRGESVQDHLFPTVFEYTKDGQIRVGLYRNGQRVSTFIYQYKIISCNEFIVSGEMGSVQYVEKVEVLKKMDDRVIMIWTEMRSLLFVRDRTEPDKIESPLNLPEK